MAKFLIKLKDGSSVEVSGRKFSYEVQGEKHDLVVHKSFDRVNGDQVTHLVSGQRICLIPSDVSCLHGRDRVAAANAALESLKGRVGEARMRAAFAAAAMAGNWNKERE